MRTRTKKIGLRLEAVLFKMSPRGYLLQLYCQLAKAGLHELVFVATYGIVGGCKWNLRKLANEWYTEKKHAEIF